MLTDDDGHEDMGQLREALASLLHLPVDAAWAAGVDGHVRVLLQNVEIVEALAVPDDIDPAPVFEA